MTREIFEGHHSDGKHPASRTKPVPEPAAKLPASLLFEDEDDGFDPELLGARATSHGLKDINFDVKTSAKDISYQLEHLTATECKQLAEVLAIFDETIFSCVLGVYHKEDVDIVLKDPAQKPIYKKAFLCANKDCPFFKRQIEQLVDLGVLERVTVSEWAFPSFMVPKKDGTARFVSNFCLLNDIIRDYQNDLPKIQDVYCSREGYQWVTSLDLTSRFYHFLLGALAGKLCVTNTPFGLYHYLCLPMDLNILQTLSRQC